MLVDDLQGTTHQVYGGTADPAYLVGVDGRVAFVNLWGSAPVLHEAIAALVARGGAGVVRGGSDFRLRLLAGLTNGWRALERGWPQSVTDLMIAAPGSPLLLWAASRLRPLHAPLTQRATPLPAPTKAGLAAAGVVAAAAALRRRGRGRRSTDVRASAPEGAERTLAGFLGR